MSSRPLLLLLLCGVLAPAARADYAVLRSGQRLHITGYEPQGSNVRLHVAGGTVDVPAAEVVAVEPEEVFPSAPIPAADAGYAELIRAAARKYALDEDLIAAVIAAESNFDPRAVSAKSARGLMQLLPETSTRLGVRDIFDPAQNIDAGARYLKELLTRYRQDLALALAAYNAGPDRVEQYRGVPPYAETRSYISRVKRRLKARKIPSEAPVQISVQQSPGMR